MLRSKLLTGVAALALTSVAVGHARADTTPIAISDGASITPTAAPGAVFTALPAPLPDFPNYLADHAETTAVSPDGSTLLILTSGFNATTLPDGSNPPQDQGEFIFVYSLANPAAPARTQVIKIPNAYSGLVWAPNSAAFYVAGGQDDNVHVFSFAGGVATEGAPIALNNPVDESFVGPVAAGLGLTADGQRLIVANYENDSISIVTLATGAIAAYDLRPGKDQGLTGVPGGEFPFWIAVKGNDTVYVSSARDRQIVAVDITAAPSIQARIPINGNPNKLTLNAAQTRLFVTADNSDALYIIDTSSNRVLSTTNTAAPVGVFQGDAPKGSAPNSVTLSPDENTAYVTNGGTNSVAVITGLKAHKPQVAGLIPTGWYPNSVSTSPDGRTLYIVNGKSVAGPNPTNCTYIPTGQPQFASACNATVELGGGNQYIFQLMKAGFLTAPTPSAADLSTLTAQVAQNNGFTYTPNSNDIATFGFLRQNIKHVIYIVKENRTYDQILGDLPQGNGDITLNQFPQPITPNLHALANGFVDLDNFYDASEVSMDGWQWSLAGRASETVEKTVPVNYGKGGASYDSEGDDRNINVGLKTLAQRIAFDPLTPNDPDYLPGTGNEMELDGADGQRNAGYLWDGAMRAGLSVRNYGFYCDLVAASLVDPAIVEPYKTKTRVAFPAKTELVNLTDPYFWSFNQKNPDFFRYKEWAREFDQFVKNGKLPNLEFVRFAHDHMGNFGSAIYGVNTPDTQQADNDYAVGLLVDKIAHSPYAASTLIFVIEDDAQDGPDHVDAHRSTGYVVGPYVKQGGVEIGARYTTVSMVRTIEDVLGLEHQNVHDSGVAPMTDVFDASKASWSFTAFPAQVLFTTQLPLLNKFGPARKLAADLPQPRHDAAWWQARTKGFDFSAEDRINSGLFNRVLWQGLMGDTPYPTIRSGADLRHHAGEAHAQAETPVKAND